MAHFIASLPQKFDFHAVSMSINVQPTGLNYYEREVGGRYSNIASLRTNHRLTNTPNKSNLDKLDFPIEAMNTIEYLFFLLWQKRSKLAFKNIEMNKDYQVKGYESTLLSDSVFVNFFRSKTLDLRAVEVHRGGRDLPMNVSFCLDQIQLKNCNFSCVQRLRVQTYSLIINNTNGYLEKFLNLAVIESLEITNNDD